MNLIFIRHADPYYPTDSLTEKGRREAALLARRVAGWTADEWYVSPKGRAQLTAKICLEGRNIEPVTLDWLKEFYVPIADMHTGEKRIPWDFLPADWTCDPVLFDKDNWYNAKIMQTGDVAAQAQLVYANLDALLARHGYFREGGYYRFDVHSEKTLVFFCHMGITMLMLAHLINVSPLILWQGLYFAPSSVTVLTSEERAPGQAYFRCQRAGDVSHLDRGGEPVSASGYFAGIFPG